MKKFEGTWRIQPFNQATLDENFGFRDSRKQGWFAGPRNALQGFHRRMPPSLSKSSKVSRKRPIQCCLEQESDGFSVALSKNGPSGQEAVSRGSKSRLKTRDHVF